MHRDTRQKVLELDLFNSVAKNDMTNLAKTIANRVDIDCVFAKHSLIHDQFTSLHMCAQMGHTESAKILLEAGARIDIPNRWGQTALMFALDNENIETASLLIGYYKESDCINVIDSKGKSALHAAVMNLSVSGVDLLLKAKANVNVRNFRGETPLHVAVKSQSSKEILDLLLSREDIDLEQPDVLLQTPLHQAAAYGNSKIVERLLSAGSEPNALDNCGMTPLMAVVFRSTSALSDDVTAKITELARSGASLNRRNSRTGQTVLHYAADKECDHHELVEILLSFGANPDVKDDHCRTPLLVALERRHEKVSQSLIMSNCDVNETKLGMSCYSPFRLALERGLFRIVVLLVKRGCRIDIDLVSGPTAMIPNVLIENPSFLSWLHYHATQPDRLISICRKKIRLMIGHSLIQDIHDLALPKTLQNYVLLQYDLDSYDLES